MILIRLSDPHMKVVVLDVTYTMALEFLKKKEDLEHYL